MNRAERKRLDRIIKAMQVKREYTEEQLLTSISEPCLASRLINYSDGTSHVEDCYITFSSDRTDLLKEYRNGVFTIVVPRDMTETSDSES